MIDSNPTTEILDKKLKKQALTQIRIIGGQWRGRKIPVLHEEGLRPTGNRLRETLFNWLQFDLPQAKCLDLFAGSGALGLEALSRGAGRVDFIDLNKHTSQQLEDNLQALEAPQKAEANHSKATRRGFVHQQSCLQYLNHSLTENDIDIVFVDPPFEKSLWEDTLNQLVVSKRLKQNSLVYVEMPKTAQFHIPPALQSYKEKSTGAITVKLLRYTM